MFLSHRPNVAKTQGFLRHSTELALSYSPIGLARTGARGFVIDELVTPLGHGPVVFDRACRALEAWRQFDTGWTELHPAGAPITPQTTVAGLIRHFGFWSLNGARVVYACRSEAGDEFGYAYGTLLNHAERGEEMFLIRRDAASDLVTYTIRAASRPRALPARFAAPLVRYLQARFRRDSAEALQRAITP